VFKNEQPATERRAIIQKLAGAARSIDLRSTPVDVQKKNETG
jgi:hypothetical protein